MSKTNLAVVGPNDAPHMTSPSGVRYQLVKISPDMARKMLASNTDNRRFRKATGERYLRDIKAGKWQENGESIKFAKDGTLLDGQHRLWAIAHGGRVVLCLVIRDLPNGAQDTMDDLAKRTLADTFNFHTIANSHSAAAITRRILMWQQGTKTNQGSFQPSKAEALEAFREDPSILVAIEAAVGMKKRRLLPPTIIGLTWWLFWNIDSDDCQAFWAGLHTGEALSSDSPIYIVREQIARHMARDGRVAETALLAWVIKAWNHYRAGKSLSANYKYTLKTSERIPEPA